MNCAKAIPLFSPWEEVRRGPAVDFHLHTAHTDGEASPEAMAKAAEKAGIRRVLFCEHVRRSSAYFPAYQEEVLRLRTPDFTAHLGVETKVLDLQGGLDCAEAVARSCDVVVGSVHSLPPDAQGQPRPWAGLSGEEAVRLEYEYAASVIRSSKAAILAHPMGMSITLFRARPEREIRALARLCRECGKAFELNPRYCPDPQAWVAIVRDERCFVSVGSDAHSPREVGRSWQTFVSEVRL
jgi:putative hydrolase